MEIFESIGLKINTIIEYLTGAVSRLGELPDGTALIYNAVARWVFIFLATFILIRSIVSLLSSRSPAEIWAYFDIDEENNVPITHWENLIGRSKQSDLQVDDPMVSRSHGTLSRHDDGKWTYMDLGSSNGTSVNGRRLKGGERCVIEPGDEISIGKSLCTIYPVSLEERNINRDYRKKATFIFSPWTSIVAITIFQIMTVIQLKFSMEEDYVNGITISFFALAVLMWTYVIAMRFMRRRAFEMETIAFFISTLSLAVTASKYPESVFKQFLSIVIGVMLFIVMCTILRNLERTKALRRYLIAASVAVLIFNLIMGTTKFGANNWITIAGLSVQPSEIVKLAFIWVGAASLDELMERRNTMIFMIFSGFCFCCFALMGDFGTALIFFVSFLVIIFLRSGDFTKVILIAGAAFVAGLLVLRFKAYIATRFSAWGHVWEFADDLGYQQTRTMSATASGGLIGVGAGRGWLKSVAASETDLVFGFVSEEWGLIIAILAVLSIITLSIFAVRSILGGRSTYYTIAACSAMSLFLFQTMLNVFGSVDLLPLTGVTFPFLSTGGTSMVASWGMLAFLKAADTRMNASLAVSNKVKEAESGK